jgi:hypothetical protein
MSLAKLLLVGVFAIIGTMVLTAMVTLIAPYAAVLTVLGFLLWFFTKDEGKKPPDKPP